MRNESGFSLVELMVVIAIIATLSIVGVAGWFGFMPSYRLRTAVDDLQATMQMARLRAIKENAVTSVRFTGTNTYRAFIDADEDGTLDGGEEVFLTRTLPAGISLHAATDAGYAQYNSRGFPEAGAMSFRLRNGRGQFLGIRMEISGAFSVQNSATGADGTWQDQYE
jgi:prepilin-type N-terminal cleavage/methylation domain-containing protein